MKKSEIEKLIAKKKLTKLVSVAIKNSDGEAIVKALSKHKLLNRVENIAECAKKKKVRKMAFAELVKAKDWDNVTKVARFTSDPKLAMGALEKLIAAKQWGFVEEIADFGNTELKGGKLKARASSALKKI